MNMILKMIIIVVKMLKIIITMMNVMIYLIITQFKMKENQDYKIKNKNQGLIQN